MFKTPCSRRKALTILKSACALGALSPLLTLFFSSCKKSAIQELEKTPATKAPIVPCPTENLSAKEIAIRDRLKYVDATPVETRNCKNCKLYFPPKDSSHCGTCSAVPGPIHPQGYCISWYHRMF